MRPEFKLIKEGKAPKVPFKDYIEMPEYQNIQTRMLGADSFPYRNIPISEQVYKKAVDVLDKMFFVGLQEKYDLSVELLLRELKRGPLKDHPKKERNAGENKNKKALKADANLMARTKEVNDWDNKLYALAVKRFCRTIAKYPDLLVRIDTKKVSC